MPRRQNTAASSPKIPGFEYAAEWGAWASALRRHRLDWIASWLLEAARPLALISSQLLYMGVPFLGRNAQKLAELLETDNGGTDFADYLSSNRGNDERLPGG